MDIVLEILNALDLAYPLTLRDKDGEVRLFWIVVAIAVPFLVVAALAMLVTVCSGISASRGYALIEVQREADRIEQENERLAIEIAKLKNPQRIKSIAETELGMSVPKKTYFSHEEK